MDALDVGCGDGAVTRVMSTIVGPGRVTGVDPNPSRVATARTLVAARGIEIEFLEGEPTRLPLAAASFDYTWARFVWPRWPSRPARWPSWCASPGRAAGWSSAGWTGSPPRRCRRSGGRLSGCWGRAAGRPGWGARLYGWCAQAGLRELTVHTLPCADGTFILVQGTVLGTPGQ